MSTTKKKRYNWKARQQKGGGGSKYTKKKQLTSSEAFGPVTSLIEKYEETHEDSSNAIILPSKRMKIENEESEEEPKRKKLSSKQKKRLQKIIETKEQKAKHAALLERLAGLALPESEMALLQPSTTISAARKTQKQILQQAQIRNKKVKGHLLSISEEVTELALCGTAWQQKKRQRRRLRVEKVLSSPRFGSKAVNDGSAQEDESTDDEDMECESSDSELAADKGKPQETANGNDVSHSMERCQRSDSDGDHLDTLNKQGQTNLAPHSHGNRTGAEETPAHSEIGGSTEVSDLTEKTAAMNEKPVARQPAMYMPLQRAPDIQAARLALPILSEEHAVMEAIGAHPVVVVCGETGSGKTTQLPQFLYEAGYTQKGENGSHSLIGVTEPRRVAAVSMSKRVAYEMGLTHRQVSYQIRYEGNTTEDTVIKFMTDGVLLREVETDFLLSRYSAIIIDEAHERSVFTDILIGLLSRIVPLRARNGRPLKLVIMSATLRVEDFTENRRLFPTPPPVVKVETRQYPVTVHFNKRTPGDYVAESYRKVCKIHRTLPPGHILVFLTGQAEIHLLCKKLRRTFPPSAVRRLEREGEGWDEGEGEGESRGKGRRKRKRRLGQVGRRKKRSAWLQRPEVKVDLDDYPALPQATDSREWEEEEGGEEHCLRGAGSSSEGEGEEGDEMEGGALDSQLPLLVLPLYSLLSPVQQGKVFKPPPEGVRMCVVATNVAETSLTIPNIKYIIDSGMVKRRFYDKVTGVSAFRVNWTSKASANQRAGRAGRTEAGHCYRLYSSAVFHNEFEQFSAPEISRRPVDDLMLQMKALNINKVVNFPFPTPPAAAAMEAAEKLLLSLGAVAEEEPASCPTVSRVTPLGRTMAQFPVSPRYAKMLALGRQHGCLPYTIAIVAALSVREIFTESGFSSENEEDEAKQKQLDRTANMRRTWAGKGECQLLGDLMVLLRAVGACEYSGCSEEFCRKNGLRHKAMLEVRKLRQQLTNSVNTVCPDAGAFIDPKMPPPSEEQARYLRQIVLSGLGDHVARKIATENMNVEDKKRFRYAYQSILCEAPVHLHRSSTLLYASPQWVVFQEVTETSKLYMRGLTAIEESWLPLLQPQYCSFSSPLELPPPFFDDESGTVKCYMTSTYGQCCWPIPAQKLPYPKGLDEYKVFAQFLLQGKVVSRLADFTPYLLTPPITMVKRWAKLHRQSEVLLSALVNKEVCTRESLLKAWKEDPKYLLKASSMWLPTSKHKTLADMWPPCS